MTASNEENQLEESGGGSAGKARRRAISGYYPWQSVVYHPFTILCPVAGRAKFASVEAGQ